MPVLDPRCYDIPRLHEERRAKRMNNGKHMGISHTLKKKCFKKSKPSLTTATKNLP